MFAKLALLILSLALGAAALLAARQMRIEAVHELASARLRILEADARLWKLRAKIAEGVTPQRVEQMASRFGRLQPLIFQDPLAQRLADGGAPAGPARPPRALAPSGRENRR